MQQIIWYSWRFEKTLAHSFWGEATQMCAMQLLNHSSWNSKGAHYDAHWGEASPMQSVLIFFNNFDMRMHEMTHSGEKPHKCSQCDFSSIQTSQLTIHMRRAHTGEKPYTCDQCDNSFVSATELQSHKISHTEEKTFQCNDCSKTFKHNKSLTRHGRIHMS